MGALASVVGAVDSGLWTAAGLKSVCFLKTQSPYGKSCLVNGQLVWPSKHLASLF